MVNCSITTPLRFLTALLCGALPLGAMAQPAVLKGETFLKQNARAEGVQTLPRGLQMKTVKEGAGKSPKAPDKVVVHYRGRLLNGTEFDSSHKRGMPAGFAVHRVIKGWAEGLQLMKGSGKAELFIPSELAHGSRGAGGLTRPDETLVFENDQLFLFASFPQPARAVLPRGALKPPLFGSSHGSAHSWTHEPSSGPAARLCHQTTKPNTTSATMPLGNVRRTNQPITPIE